MESTQKKVLEPTVAAQVETITPEAAAAYLKRNTDNYRKISMSKVAMYAAEMKAGNWELNGEGIMFDQTGRLKNGQHRLAAILQAKVPVRMLVVRGVQDDVSIYDSGMTRNIRQIAQASGCKDISGVAAAAGTMIAWGFTRIPKGLALDYIKAHQPELERAARLCSSSSGGCLSRRASAVIATALQLFDGMKSYEAEVFFKVFNSGNTVGADGYEPSPALVARRMIESGYRMRAANDKTQKEKLEIFTLAMIDFRKGATRQMNYKLQEPFKGLALMEKMRKAQGMKGV